MTKKSNVYTRTGDKGMTSLIGGIRVPKTHARLEAYGTVDELNSQIGVLMSYVNDEHDYNFLLGIQNMLFVVGSNLATDTSMRQLSQGSVVAPEKVMEMEKEIDELDASLPPLRAFVLPSGCRAAAVAHVCRTVCRRAERRILALRDTCEVDEQVMLYVNRLSDYLFVFARKLNVLAGNSEIFWKRT
jgi:cob(I)alamin adenosyltransferase